MTLVNRSRVIRKGKASGRIIKVQIVKGRERQLHATKGWRSYRSNK